MNAADLEYGIRSHLVYELKWMIHAAARLRPGEHADNVALTDSAVVHARNLFEFCYTPGSPKRFNLAALGGKPTRKSAWVTWANNRVTHMLDREHHREPWPEGLDVARVDRLMVMADRVIGELERGGGSLPVGPLRDAYLVVVGAARRYWQQPTEHSHQQLASLYDPSRDIPGQTSTVTVLSSRPVLSQSSGRRQTTGDDENC